MFDSLQFGCRLTARSINCVLTVFNINEGMLHENIVAQTIVSAGKTPYFYTHYSREKHRNDIEIDFLLSEGSKTSSVIIPVKVKSSKNYSTTSYHAFKERFSHKIGQSIIVHPKGFMQDENGMRLPSYMFFVPLKKNRA